jgi:hypothetical protein
MDEIYFLHILGLIGNTILALYTILLFLHALVTTKSLKVGLLSVVAAFTQLIAYGSGFLSQYAHRFITNKRG